MFKSRKRAVPRCTEGRQFAERFDSKRRKSEGNSNITSNRVTIPPGFLCLGVKSQTVRRSQKTENFESDRDCILNEDLHRLFNDNSTRPRRSVRIAQKSKDTLFQYDLTTPQHHSKGPSTGNGDYQAKNEPEKAPRRKKTFVRNNSKSIFRDINERCSKAQAKHRIIFDYPISAILESDSKIERLRPSLLCLNLSREITVDLDQHHYLLDTKSAVHKGIHDINRVLRGEMDLVDAAPDRNQRQESQGKAAQGIDFRFLPRDEWIFKTPPRQRVVLPKAEGCSIQPAVICTTKKRSNIYELNPDCRVDLTGYHNRQNVPVDGRYMRHLASFEEHMEAEASFKLDGLGVTGQDAGSGLYGDTQFHFPDHISPIAFHFSQVTSRPTKTVRKRSRIAEIGDVYQSVADFERDVTFVGEGDGRFKMVDKRCAAEEISSSPFKFRKVPVQLVGRRLFDFDEDEPKMFDFSQLKNN